ncbi:hypothetical protein GMORB2_6800 [Geosmithia morbida]|uniref:Uncharacterized protein n=1 Tax=Geosmithia morbida TaxID=1094350 RepID=A0A9P4YWD6_9HYPO|nr:uncharacterized protein GMORB2_6800 [Geosmithia morbida]KAF4123250.1 hypothetical protein GMORB2_6800 [Geosmithia morbida]
MVDLSGLGCGLNSLWQRLLGNLLASAGATRAGVAGSVGVFVTPWPDWTWMEAGRRALYNHEPLLCVRPC